MAGDWIKMRNDLWTDPRVTGMADALEVGEATIIGGVFFLWTTADLHSVDGFLKGLSLRALDRRAGIPGLGAELCRVGWLSEHADGLQVENFDRHNSASAKRRAQDARRKASQRQQPPDSEHFTRRPQRSYQPSTSPQSTDKSPQPVPETSAEHPQAVPSVSACAADATGTGTGARVRERVRERKELENPPPPPLLSADCAGSTSAPAAAWVAAVEAELLDLGIDDLSCLQEALAAGLIEPAIRELLRHYREHQQAQDWTPKALHYRLRTAKTSLPSDRGWPQPGPAAQRQQAQSEQQRQQQRQQAQREQQRAAEQQRKALAAQTYDALDRQFGKILDNLSTTAVEQLAASVSTDLARRLRQKGDRKTRSIRGPLLGRLAGQRAEQLESELGPQLDQLPPKELQDLAAIAGTHCLQQVKDQAPLTGQLRHQLLLTLFEQTAQVST